jgi:opacity protein-like surface antigen
MRHEHVSRRRTPGKGGNVKKAMIVAVTMAAACILAPAAAQAQSGRFALEVRAGAAMPGGQLQDAFAETGFSISADAMLNLSRRFTAYGGLSLDEFGCNGSCDGPTSQGFQTGLKFLFMPEGRVLPWIRGGLIGQRLETDSWTDLSFGYEAGAGADIAFSPRWSVVPHVRYRDYNAEWPSGFGLNARWLTLGVGAHYHF